MLDNHFILIIRFDAGQNLLLEKYKVWRPLSIYQYRELVNVFLACVARVLELSSFVHVSCLIFKLLTGMFFFS